MFGNYCSHRDWILGYLISHQWSLDIQNISLWPKGWVVVATRQTGGGG